MLALGVNPAEEIDVRRNGEPAFDRYKTVEWWAARTVVEDGEHGPRIRLLTPTERPHSANSASPAPDLPEDATSVSGPSIPASE
jgi:hypothetical protein